MNKTTLALIFAAGTLAAGCKSNEPKPEEAAAASAPAAAQQQAPAPAPAKPECPPEEPKSKKKTDKSKSAKNKTAEKPVDCEPAKPAAAAPAAAAPAARAGRLMHGPYDISANKPVTDISQVQSGQGTMVKGEREWEGEITGIPAAGTTFTKLRIGMSRQQAIDTAGPPTDQGAYITGKAWIPFYFGSDRARWEMSYKGKGRLIFSQNAGFGTDFYLTWIIHNDKDTGYR
ncbi:hypothetical protein AB6Q56_14905 [Dechloromonas sp. ARDL1]|uniref:hypothetical protein n=1 Tax=Dechloromonas sp. ARDL1 TaxID=3322121 RepID=UPI003DA6D42E